MNDRNCLGIIETDGLAAALEAADVMLKSPPPNKPDAINLQSLQNYGDRVAVLVIGELGPIQAAVEAGAKAAERKGKVLGRNVISRCDGRLIQWLDRSDVNITTSITDRLEEISRALQEAAAAFNQED